MFIVIYILIFIYLSNVKKFNLIFFVYVILLIFVGCLNENIFFVVVLIFVVYFFIMNRNKYLLIGVFGFVIGVGVFLLVLGNLFCVFII